MPDISHDQESARSLCHGEMVDDDQVMSDMFRGFKLPEMRRWQKYVMTFGLLGLGLFAVVHRRSSEPAETPVDQDVAEFALPGEALEVKAIIAQHGLTGVNLGGWLCMEDWLNSGHNGSEVSTLGPPGQGECLPPTRKIMSPWSSEGLLVKRLIDESGTKLAIDSISAYRDYFITLQDLDQIALAGMHWVRLPLTWVAFADALGQLYPDIYGKHDPDSDAVIVPDPYYKDDAAFVTMPRATLVIFIREAKKRGLQVILDLHNAPGGAQQGTYNGVWPKDPVFWKEKSRLKPSVPLTLLGKLLAEGMVKWVESLPEDLMRNVAGVTLMNEPGHMNGILKPFAQEETILKWLEEVAGVWRRSTLPRTGVKLYMSLIETAFKDIKANAVPWFKNFFTPEERRTTVVAELHFYMAWNKNCAGSTQFGSAYQCGNSKSQGVQSGCAYGAASAFRSTWGEETQIAINEFSMATSATAKTACKDRASLTSMLKYQLDAFQHFGFKTSFWTWKTSYAREFQAGWSLKWLMGMESKDAGHWCR